MAKKKAESVVDPVENLVKDGDENPKAAKPPKEPKAPKAPKEPKPPKAVKIKVEQNGITRPEPGTKTGRVWEICDQISANTGKPADRKDVLEAGEAEGLNDATITTQHGRWREFHGLVTKRAPKDPVAAVANVTPVAGVVEPVSE
jgi:hypothetical protein